MECSDKKGKKKVILNSKSPMKISALLKSTLANSQLQNQQKDDEMVNVIFYFNGKAVKEIPVKKMSIIKDPVMETYEIFHDEACQKPLNKKITIAFGDKKLFCQRKSAQSPPEEPVE